MGGKSKNDNDSRLSAAVVHRGAAEPLRRARRCVMRRRIGAVNRRGSVDPLLSVETAIAFHLVLQLE